MTEIVRVFRVEALSENETASNLPYTVMSGNTTIKTGTTSETGAIVFPLKFRRECSLVQNPQPGGPYLRNLDNFTAPLTLRIGAQATEFGFTSDTPVRVQLVTEDTSLQTSVPVNLGSIIVLKLIVLGALVYRFQKDKTHATFQMDL